MVNGGGYGTFAKVGGTTSIYKYTLGAVQFHFQLPFIANSGANTIQNISGAASALTDAGANWQACVVVQNGECWAGSTAGQIYANLPVVDAASGNVCDNGGEAISNTSNDWCM